MKYLLHTVLILSVIPIFTFSQVNNTKWLINKFKKADTVLLISHEPVLGSTNVIANEKGEPVQLPALIVDRKPNRRVVKEEVVLDNKGIDSLLQILVRRNKDSVRIFQEGGCFVSRQTIFLIKNHTTSYIDLCFHCQSYETSKDLKNTPLFDNRIWQEMEAFFKKLGFKYELDISAD